MGKKNARGFATGNISDNWVLGTLGDNVAVKSSGFGQSSRHMTVISLDVGFTLKGLTPGEGPIDFGVAHSDYTVGEIIENLSSNAGWDSGNLIEMEQSRRMVRLLGSFEGQQANEDWNDGKFKRVRLRWPVSAGAEIVAFAINRSDAALTTGAEMEAKGKGYIRNHG